MKDELFCPKCNADLRKQFGFYEGINVQNFDKKKLHVNLGNLKLTICTLLNDKSDEIKE